MEPLTTSAIALASVIATKALEKTGQNLGDTIWEQTKHFVSILREQSPDTVAIIEEAPEQPLDYNKMVLESDHQDIAISLDNLANLYSFQGRYEAAEPLYLEALAMKQRIWISDHQDIATSLDNLANLYILENY
ncbi:MAG TPA: hypothetical protein DCF68_07295 [Cyanothece sp. UBA12306]|nr:hypothetical protein [Cyanothece sp. UBA12306]